MRGTWQNSGLVFPLPWKRSLYLLFYPQFWRCEVSCQAHFSVDKRIQFLICLPNDCMQGIYFHVLSNWSKKHFLSTRDHYSSSTAIRPTQVVYDTWYDDLRDIQNVAKWSSFTVAPFRLGKGCKNTYIQYTCKQLQIVIENDEQKQNTFQIVMLITLHAEWHAELSNFSSMLRKGVIKEQTTTNTRCFTYWL